ncbi:hypothetical protein [Sporosarcina obsidiansis]|uniref:hypothetical protein n=1 Tax=Sporosarcina obsidiansis TaxID=2660748 RepID=UPI00129AA398|nr:hypothetical protein [Sporosarcina obsidiansis]
MGTLELEVLNQHKDWLIEVNRTAITKSYKMVVLQYMLSRGSANWHKPVTPVEVAPYFHGYLMEKAYRRDVDLADKRGKTLHIYNEAKTANLIADMPMTKWSGSSKGRFLFEDGVFVPQLDVANEHKEVLFKWVKEICEYRLQWYFGRKIVKKTTDK